MEKILGVPVGRDETIPGTVDVEGLEFIYFSDDGVIPVGSQFDALTQYTNPPYAQRGGAILDGCSLTLPDGSTFHAIVYHGDIHGWRQDIMEGARGLNITLARIDTDKIIIADGRIFNLTECMPKFDWKNS